jgi:hypothetical protein
MICTSHGPVRATAAAILGEVQDTCKKWSLGLFGLLQLGRLKRKGAHFGRQP